MTGFRFEYIRKKLISIINLHGPHIQGHFHIYMDYIILFRDLVGKDGVIFERTIRIMTMMSFHFPHLYNSVTRRY